MFVKISGRPVPVLTWTKPGVDLNNRGFIEVTNTSTTLIIDKVHRYDAGKYTLVAENSAGKQEVNILVKVYGKLISCNFSIVCQISLFMINVINNLHVMPCC